MKEILIGTITSLIATAIASLIGNLFNGRYKLLKRFFNQSENLKFKLFFYVFQLALVIYPTVVFISYVFDLKTFWFSFSLSIAFITVAFLTAIITRSHIRTDSKVDCIKEVLRERKTFLEVYGRLEFICKIEGVTVAFYYIKNVAHFAPVDISEVDPVKWKRFVIKK